MDCSKTEAFLAERSRLCDSEYYCADCVLKDYCYIANEEKMYPVYDEKAISKMMQIVQEWSDTHQPKTRLSVLKEQYPNLVMDENKGIPIDFCAGVLYGYEICKVDEENKQFTCVKCWNTPIEDDNNA